MELTTSDSKSLVPGEPPPPPTIPDASTHLPPLVRGWQKIPRGRQIGIIAALALVAAIAIAMLLWAKEPEYAMLFGEMPEKSAGEIVEALQKLNIQYKIDPATGTIQVPADQVHALRLKMAGMGLPKDGSVGFELLDKETGFGVSQLVEGARYQRAMEGEIARSITTIKHVKSARVHLALPKESVFVRQPRQASASVMIELQPGYSLDPGQVDAIIYLVAASVPQLEPEQVTIVDQQGHHLVYSKTLENNEDFQADKQLKQLQFKFEYKQQVEEHLIERVENILRPVMGSDGVRTQVSADVDFAVTERTQEVYNPDQPALRSEQSSEEQNRNAGPQGIPGALTNQPPPAGVAPEIAGQNGQGGKAGQDIASTTTKSATRNYELDRTISHTKLGTGILRRVTAAAVVDLKRVQKPDGTFEMQPYSDAELARFTDLVKEAVGYDPARGDRVTVTNAAFHPGEVQPPLQWWEQPWVVPLLKYLGTGLVLLLLIFGVLRPLVKGLTGQAAAEREAAERAAAEAAAVAAAADTGEAKEGVLADDEPGENRGPPGLDAPEEELMMLEAPESHGKRLEFVQRAIDEDSKRVAQVIKNWIAPPP